MRTFILKVVTREADLVDLVGRTMDLNSLDEDTWVKARLGIQGAWEMEPNKSRTFVFVNEEIIQGDATVRHVPDGKGFAITSSQEGQRTPGLKAAAVSKEDADRLRDISEEK